MPEFKVEFSKLKIGVKSIYDFTERFCFDYLTQGDVDFSVSTSEEKIREEIEISEFDPTPDYAESICIYREIAERLPLYNRCIFHGAVIEYNNKGYIFTAPSGTGKTTHISLWKKYLGNENVNIVNGDKPILHIRENAVTAYATPYAGKEGYQNHSFVDIKAICFIKQAKENKIYRLKSSECLADIMAQIYRPYNSGALVKTLELLDLLMRGIPVYRLECDMSEDAVKCSFEGLTEERYVRYED